MKKMEMIALSHDNKTAGVKDAPEKMTVTDFGTLEGRNGVVLYIRDSNGKTYATNSGAFIETFRQAMEAFEEEGIKEYKIIIQANRARNGREYRIALPDVD